MIDVVIIGGGPVGLLLANLLGRRGASVRVLEKQHQLYPMPRAIHFDAEAMRAFQAAGLAHEILPHTHVGTGMLFRNATGKTLLDWSRAQTVGPMGWYESYRFYQPGLEYELRAGLERFGRVSLQGGAEAVRISQTGAGVTLGLADGTELSAAYVVGADGTNSFTRSALGTGLHDLGFRERWLVIDAVLKHARDDLGDHSIQYCDPDAPATYVRGVGARRRWELRLTADDPEAFPEAEIWPRLARWITPGDAELERAAVYTFRSRIAESWRQGRILLAGDAAHQMPPFMGQGMCAGVRDAANLAWKLSAVLGGADDALLDTYQSEREANARAFIEKSVALGRLINQTAAGHIPKGRMHSIWPDLGPGLGERDGVGGALVPQTRSPAGLLADDAANHGFYVLAARDMASPLPCITGAQDWLAEHGLAGVVVRPDGYALGGFNGTEGLDGLASLAALFDPADASIAPQ